MDQIKRILENQKEVKYLCYFLFQDERDGHIELHCSTLDIVKKRKYKSEQACLDKLIDLLFELKKLEKWAEGRSR